MRTVAPVHRRDSILRRCEEIHWTPLTSGIVLATALPLFIVPCFPLAASTPGRDSDQLIHQTVDGTAHAVDPAAQTGPPGRWNGSGTKGNYLGHVEPPDDHRVDDTSVHPGIDRRIDPPQMNMMYRLRYLLFVSQWDDASDCLIPIK
ncbi:hypothetical protein M2318_001797 [Metapseudomonas resinovorans]|uniref:hypothetical protein n=1 Tax=Metapseudomonas resinovorans TaxID=53412 RepID=UPI003D244EDC